MQYVVLFPICCTTLCIGLRRVCVCVCVRCVYVCFIAKSERINVVNMRLYANIALQRKRIDSLLLTSIEISEVTGCFFFFFFFLSFLLLFPQSYCNNKVQCV